MKANQKMEKNGSLRGTRSKFYPDMSLGQICRDMIQDVINRDVLQHPFIALVTKGQIVWGKGTHWKYSDAPLQIGLGKHFGIVSNPTQRDIEYQKKRYGWSMVVPEPKTWGLSGEVMKKDFINKKCEGKEFQTIEFLYGRGYVDNDGNLDPEYTRAITGWFIINTRPDVRKTQVEWVRNQADQIRKRWSKYVIDYIPTVTAQIESGHKKAVINSVLLGQSVYKEIDKLLEASPNQAALEF